MITASSRYENILLVYKKKACLGVAQKVKEGSTEEVVLEHSVHDV